MLCISVVFNKYSFDVIIGRGGEMAKNSLHSAMFKDDLCSLNNVKLKH